MPDISTIPTEELLRMRQPRPKPEIPEFEQRMNQPNAPFIKNADGSISTHLMRHDKLIDGSWIAYPSIINRDGKLEELSGPDAFTYALANNEYRKFDSEKDAEVYAKGSWKKNGANIQGVSTENLLTARRNNVSKRSRKIDELFGQMGGKVPLTEESIRRMSGTAAGSQYFAAESVQQRRRAFEELEGMGFTRKQMEMSLGTQSIVGRPRIGRTVGGLVGAIGTTVIAGRFIPGPIDDAAIIAALVAAGGAGGGGIAGEAAQIAIEEKRIIDKREALSAFAIEAGTELGGRAVVVTGKFFLSPFIRKTVPEAAALVDDFAKVGGHYSPTELDSRFSLRIAESFSRGSFGTKEIFQEFEEQQGKAVLAFADSIIDSIGEGVVRLGPEEIGSIFAEGITRPGGRIFRILDELFDPLYRQLDDLTKTARVSTRSLKSFRSKLVQQNQRLVAASKRTGKELPLISPAGKQLLNDIDNLPNYVSHSDYRAFRTKTLREARKLGRDVDVSEVMVKKISDITKKELLSPETVAGASPEAKRLHANISRLYATTQDVLETTFSEKLAKRLLRNPSGVIKDVFPNNNPKAIRLLRKSLVEPISGKPSAEGKILWNQLRQEWLADVVSEATKEGVAKPKVYNNLIRKFGDKGLREMFPERDIYASVQTIQTIFETAGKTPPTGTSLYSRGAQIAGVVMMAKGYKEGDYIGFTAGATLTMGPLAFAKLAVNPRGVKLLIKGFNLRPGASGLIPLAARMIKLRNQINNMEKRQLKAIENRKLQKRSLREKKEFEQQFSGFGGIYD